METRGRGQRRVARAAGLALALCALLVPGCTGAKALAPLDPSHPASPQAAEAPLPDFPALGEGSSEEGGVAHAH